MTTTWKNRVYDVLKPITTTLLPGAGALYFALAQIWGFPNGEEVVGTIAAVNVFLGLWVTVSSVSYNKSDAKYDGEINVEDTPERTKFSLDLDTDPNTLKDQQTVLFRVKKTDSK